MKPQSPSDSCICFERLSLGDIDPVRCAEVGEINVFQTPQWVSFVARTYNAEPVVAAVKSGELILGYFTGLITKRAGLRILGSPFRGWSTYFMGFNLLPDVSREAVLKAFPDFVFNQLKCHYYEVIDPCFKRENGMRLSCRVESVPWLSLDLRPDEDHLLANMKGSRRLGIRVAVKNGVIIEEASDIGFADEYYAQYLEVMAKHGLPPTYPVSVVRQLIESLSPTGTLLLLYARNREGYCIATAIFLCLGDTAIYWGGASRREYQNLRPNDLLIWHAIRVLKGRGARVFHMGGGVEQFKQAFGCQDAGVFRLKQAKSIWLDVGLNVISSCRNPRFINWFVRKMQPCFGDGKQ